MAALRRVLLVALGAAMAGAPKAHAGVRRIVHFSDVHLNLSTSLDDSQISLKRPRYGSDTPLNLLEAALTYASRIVAQPDVVLYTGDHVTHGDGFSNEYIRKVVETNVRMLESVFPTGSTKKPIHVTAITGNSDSNLSYAMDVTDPMATTVTNAALSVVSPVWASSISTADSKRFERRGYLQYDIDDKLTILTLNTVPYSPSHFPDTSHLEDPFGQFAWLDATLLSLRETSRIAFIAGHIPPIVDSNRTNVMWHEHYIRSYRSIISSYRDVIKAQFFGHVHSMEFRIPPIESDELLHDLPLPPLFTTGAVSPKYGNNPSFTVWAYDADSYEVLDFTIHSTDWVEGRPFEWRALFQASSAYGLSSLSTHELTKLRSRMESTASSTLTEYYWNMKARSYNLPPCDSTSCRARTLCSLSWWPTQTAFAQCVRERTPTALSADLHSLLLLHLAMAVVALVVAYSVVCAVARRRRRVAHGAPYNALKAHSPMHKITPHKPKPSRALSTNS